MPNTHNKPTSRKQPIRGTAKACQRKRTRGHTLHDQDVANKAKQKNNKNDKNEHKAAQSVRVREERGARAPLWEHSLCLRRAQTLRPGGREFQPPTCPMFTLQARKSVPRPVLLPCSAQCIPHLIFSPSQHPASRQYHPGRRVFWRVQHPCRAPAQLSPRGNA